MRHGRGIAGSVGAEKFGSVLVHMAEFRPFLKVAMDEEADNPLHAVFENRFLLDKKGQGPSSAGTAKGGGRVQGVQIGGNGKKQGDKVPFRKMVLDQQPVVQGGSLEDNVLFFVAALKGPPQGVDPLHEMFPPVRAKIKSKANETKKLKGAKTI
jgi:hypothetical protein